MEMELNKYTLKDHKPYNGTMLMQIKERKGKFLQPKAIFLNIEVGAPFTRSEAVFTDGKYVDGEIEDCTKIECIDRELPSLESWNPFDD